MDELTKIIITAIVSPITLKLIEYVLNKSSEQTKSMNAKVEGLSARVDELKEKNLRQEIEIGVLKAQLADRDTQMMERDRLIAELKKELDLLQDRKERE